MIDAAGPGAIAIREENPAQPDIIALLEAGEAHSATLYPAESNHHLPLAALLAPQVRFFVARDPAGRALATGAIVLNGDWAEVKRMWVVEDARGRGLSKVLLAVLVTTAREAGVSTLRLETGVASHAALGLYRAAGFAECGPFADYAEDPLSVFMEMPLAPDRPNEE